MEKEVYTLDWKPTKEELRRDRYELNQKKAKSYVLIFESRIWYEMVKRMPLLYPLNGLFGRLKPIPLEVNELIRIMTGKIQAVEDLDFELAARYRDHEVQMRNKVMEKYNIDRFEYSRITLKKGRIKLILFCLKMKK